MKNESISNLNVDQIINRKFDGEHDADRVYLVGGEKLELSIDSDKIANAVKEGLSHLKLDNKAPVGSIQRLAEDIAESKKQPNIIEKNVFIPQLEVKTIEVPVIIKETEYKTIEVPVIIEKTVYKEIEKPVIIKEIQYKEVHSNKMNIYLFVAQLAILAINLLMRK